MKLRNTYLPVLEKILTSHGITVVDNGTRLLVSDENQLLKFYVAGEDFDFKNSKDHPFIPLDYLMQSPEKIAAILLSQMKRNKKVFARNCIVKKISKAEAQHFLDAYHLMNSTSSAYNLGLFLTHELLAVASFSKGRKMNRLAENKRSFELIRFCSKSGVSIAGGLSKLVKSFYLDKEAGDIMTYVDKQWTNGSSFLKADFKKHSETGSHYFLVSKKDYTRSLPVDPATQYDHRTHYLTQNSGNIKMIYLQD